MSENRFCRVCAGRISDPDNAWVDLPKLGRFWVCVKCRWGAAFLWTDDVGYVFIGHGGLRLVLGPYPYEPSRLTPET